MPRPENVRRIRKALSYLEDNAVAEVGDDEISRYGVVCVADQIVVDLMARACSIDFEEARDAANIEMMDIEGVSLRVATKEMLIRMKQTARPADAADVEYPKLRLSEEK